MWLLHYVYRAFVYPFRGPTGQPMPAVVAAMAFSFNLVNATINGAIPAPDPARYASVGFWLGTALFLGGMWLNHDADARLRALRARTGGYAIPTGGAYRWVSCPNYLGEIVQWWGWALLTGALPGLAFAIFTTANLAPRAFSNHAWYKRTFPTIRRSAPRRSPWPWRLKRP
ncbi:MAG: methyltransferase [Myxococcota bacterium]